MNPIQQLAPPKSVPLHVNSPAIACYPWQTAILKATDLDDTFKSTNLKVKSLSLPATPSNYLYSIGFLTKTCLIREVNLIIICWRWTCSLSISRVWTTILTPPIWLSAWKRTVWENHYLSLLKTALHWQICSSLTASLTSLLLWKGIQNCLWLTGRVIIPEVISS